MNITLLNYGKNILKKIFKKNIHVDLDLIFFYERSYRTYIAELCSLKVIKQLMYCILSENEYTSKVSSIPFHDTDLIKKIDRFAAYSIRLIYSAFTI